MAKVSEVIKKLQRMEEENGDVELTVYNSISGITCIVKEDEIYFDDTYKDIYIGISQRIRKEEQIKEV